MWNMGLLLVRSPKKLPVATAWKAVRGESRADFENRLELEPSDLRCNPFLKTGLLRWSPQGTSQPQPWKLAAP